MGGDDIDRAVAEQIKKSAGIEDSTLTAEQKSRLLDAARTAKESLSEKEETTVELPFFDGKKVSNRAFANRAEFPGSSVLEKTRSIGRRAFLEAEQKSPGEIDHLILVGGSTRMPLVRTKLEEWFGIEPDLSQHPDEAIAIGAAIQAGILCGRVRQVVLLDVVPLSFGNRDDRRIDERDYPRNTTIPAKAGELFTNGVSDQKSMAVRILQGERELARDNWLLGEVNVPFEPGPKGSARVGVEFSIDQNGILTVLARDTKTDSDHILKIEGAAVDVADEAVEKWSVNRSILPLKT